MQEMIAKLQPRSPSASRSPKSQTYPTLDIVDGDVPSKAARLLGVCGNRPPSNAPEKVFKVLGMAPAMRC
jgi:hypothetical protein